MISARLWAPALAALVAVRVLVPLVALAAEGRSLRIFPRYEYEPAKGDGPGFYAAAREFIAAWPRLGVLLPVVALAALAAAVAIVRAWRRGRADRAWLVVAASATVTLPVTAAVLKMEATGAAVFGWPLVWSIPMLPARVVGVLDYDVAFALGLPLSLAANAVTVVATAYAGLRATGRREVGLLAAALFALWPFLLGVLGGSRAWENGTWNVDAGLVMYTEPLSTALVAVALAVVVGRDPSRLALAAAGVALGLATATKLSNGLVAVGVALLLGRRALPLVAAGLTWVPVVAAYWPLGYASLFDNPRSWPRDPFSPRHADDAWLDSTLFHPRTLAIMLPLAIAGVVALRGSRAAAILALPIVTNAAFYSFYRVTPFHPRFLFAALPALFVLQAAGVFALMRGAVGERPGARAPTPPAGSRA